MSLNNSHGLHLIISEIFTAMHFAVSTYILVHIVGGRNRGEYGE